MSDTHDQQATSGRAEEAAYRAGAQAEREDRPKVNPHQPAHNALSARLAPCWHQGYIDALVERGPRT